MAAILREKLRAHLGKGDEEDYFYLAGCTTFPHLPAPIKQFDHFIIFFLQLLLSFQSSSVKPFSPISPVIPSAQRTEEGSLPKEGMKWRPPGRGRYLLINRDVARFLEARRE
jgi:hypothetical protein